MGDRKGLQMRRLWVVDGSPFIRDLRSAAWRRQRCGCPGGLWLVCNEKAYRAQTLGRQLGDKMGGRHELITEARVNNTKGTDSRQSLS